MASTVAIAVSSRLRANKTGTCIRFSVSRFAFSCPMAFTTSAEFSVGFVSSSTMVWHNANSCHLTIYTTHSHRLSVLTVWRCCTTFEPCHWLRRAGKSHTSRWNCDIRCHSFRVIMRGHYAVRMLQAVLVDYSSHWSRIGRCPNTLIGMWNAQLQCCWNSSGFCRHTGFVS